MNKKILINTLMICVLASGAYPANTTGDAGTAPAQFLKLGAGGKPAGMGDAYSAVCGDSSAVYWNPAALINCNSTSVVLMHTTYISDLFYDWASLSFALGNFRIGTGVTYFSGGSVPTYDSSANSTGSISPYDMSAAVSLAYDFGGFGLGITGKYISLNLGDTASTFTGDAGLFCTLPLNGGAKVNAAIAVSNFTGSLKFATATENLPMNVRVGLGIIPMKGLTIDGDYNMPSDNTGYYAVGAELGLPIDGSSKLYLRGGYNNRSTLGGLSFGGGVSLGELSIDYAYIPYSDAGNINRFSLGLDFGNPEKRKVSGSLAPAPLGPPANDENARKFNFTQKNAGSGSRMIKGYVLDRNWNKVSRARISLYKGGKEIDSLTSAEDGTYTTGELKPGIYTLAFWHQIAGFTSAQVTVEETGTMLFDVIISPEQAWNIITGRVVSDSAFPGEESMLSSALVNIYYDGKEAANLITDEEGYFKSRELKFGEYEIRAWRKGFKVSSTRVVLVPGDPVKTNLQLSPIR